MKRSHLLAIFAATAVVLALPAIAMQFSEEVNWGIEDFIAVGILLIGAGILYEFISAKITSSTQRLIAGGAVIATVLIVWVQLAVGIFD